MNYQTLLENQIRKEIVKDIGTLKGLANDKSFKGFDFCNLTRAEKDLIVESFPIKIYSLSVVEQTVPQFRGGEVRYSVNIFYLS